MFEGTTFESEKWVYSFRNISNEEVRAYLMSKKIYEFSNKFAESVMAKEELTHKIEELKDLLEVYKIKFIMAVKQLFETYEIEFNEILKQLLEKNKAEFMKELESLLNKDKIKLSKEDKIKFNETLKNLLEEDKKRFNKAFHEIFNPLYSILTEGWMNRFRSLVGDLLSLITRWWNKQRHELKEKYNWDLQAILLAIQNSWTHKEEDDRKWLGEKIKQIKEKYWNDIIKKLEEYQQEAFNPELWTNLSQSEFEAIEKLKKEITRITQEDQEIFLSYLRYKRPKTE